ncbi:cell division ZapA family protein [Neorickettsia helminthoeca str. Oregon]|uniref:Cell division ZapA family protein n=1 Tax=Neorickettsia helminthoeca str. Oregon TaxID=1286528 RepID=X5HMF2_9RICK|nr:cell division protein ZapA [Neorickettsia helminthoeca]AHX11645.1 cell division ZapA family protein [Neorickettsia helminthoeca str. Oregon]
MSKLITKSIVINNTTHKIACTKEDEKKLEYLAERLDKRMKVIADSSNSKINDITLLLFAALELENLLLDSSQNNDNNARNTTHQQEKIIDYATSAIENFIEHVENMD